MLIELFVVPPLTPKKEVSMEYPLKFGLDSDVSVNFSTKGF